MHRSLASSRLGTPTNRSMMGFDGRPGTAVLPMCSMAKANEPRAFPILARSCSNSVGQLGSQSETTIDPAPYFSMLPPPDHVLRSLITPVAFEISLLGYRWLLRVI